eukprot:768411-Hanusia_phi.AAC.1
MRSPLENTRRVTSRIRNESPFGSPSSGFNIMSPCITSENEQNFDQDESTYLPAISIFCPSAPNPTPTYPLQSFCEDSFQVQLIKEQDSPETRSELQQPYAFSAKRSLKIQTCCAGRMIPPFLTSYQRHMNSQLLQLPPGFSRIETSCWGCRVVSSHASSPCLSLACCKFEHASSPTTLSGPLWGNCA